MGSQYGLYFRSFLRRKRTEGVRLEDAGLFVGLGVHVFKKRVRYLLKCRRSCCMALRILVFTVPSGTVRAFEISSRVYPWK